MNHTELQERSLAALGMTPRTGNSSSSMFAGHGIPTGSGHVPCPCKITDIFTEAPCHSFAGVIT
jgi:hypothetical protein